MEVKDLINKDKNDITLVAVSKTKPIEEIKKKYKEGIINFGENRVNELVEKFNHLPKDINWHMIGHLQTNKVKKIIPFISLIHSVDSVKLINKIENESKRLNIPFLAIPLPSSKDNHQYENAKFYQDLDCCWIIDQKSFDNQKFENFLLELINKRMIT